MTVFIQTVVLVCLGSRQQDVCHVERAAIMLLALGLNLCTVTVGCIACEIFLCLCDIRDCSAAHMPPKPHQHPHARPNPESVHCTGNTSELKSQPTLHGQASATRAFVRSGKQEYAPSLCQPLQALPCRVPPQYSPHRHVVASSFQSILLARIKTSCLMPNRTTGTARCPELQAAREPSCIWLRFPHFV